MSTLLTIAAAVDPASCHAMHRPDRNEFLNILKPAGETVAKKRRYLTATMADGYVKKIGPTNHKFTHYWRIVAQLENRKTEVFWGHSRTLAEAKKKHIAAKEACQMRGWVGYGLEIVELIESFD